MNKFFVTALIFLAVQIGYSQTDIKGYVSSHQKQIVSIDPSSEDYSDLETIGESIGGARIIMLGEQDHGDAPTFLAKTRLIKYLHEKKGFTVLAFESDFFSINYNWPRVANGEMSMNELVSKNLTPVWTQCSACDPLFKEYLPSASKTEHPLAIAGFDNQVGTRFLLPLLDSVMREWQLPITSRSNYKSVMLPLFDTWYNYTADTATTDKIIALYREIKSQMQSKVKEEDFWVQTVENLIQQNLQFRNWRKDYWKDMNTRDRQMAANLKWLSQIKYPNEKIIVWAHNYHVSKYGGHYPEDFMNKATTMGSVFTADSVMAKQTYIIGFSSYQGTAGRVFAKTYKLPKPKAASFENWINPTYDFAFVDFKAYNNSLPGKQNFFMSGSIKGSGHQSHEAEWNQIFDGVFFIRNMYPCEKW